MRTRNERKRATSSRQGSSKRKQRAALTLSEKQRHRLVPALADWGSEVRSTTVVAHFSRCGRIRPVVRLFSDRLYVPVRVEQCCGPSNQEAPDSRSSSFSLRRWQTPVCIHYPRRNGAQLAFSTGSGTQEALPVRTRAPKRGQKHSCVCGRYVRFDRHRARAKTSCFTLESMTRQSRSVQGERDERKGHIRHL